MKTFKLTNLVLPLVVVLSAFSFSCAKKATGVRAVRQTEAQQMNPVVNTNSNNAANAQGLLYKITVIELPGEATDGSFTVNAEIKTPMGRFIPITTTHTAGRDVYGTYNDADTGAYLDIRARCMGANCDTYLLLVTVVKNNQSVHQSLAISYLTESFFHLDENNATVSPGNFYRSLDEVVQRHNLK